MTARALAAARGAWLGIAAFALVAYVLLLLGGSVPPALFPVALALGATLGFVRTGDETLPCAPRWLVWTCAVPVLATVAMLAYGALASGDREWDSTVSWTLRAKWLLEAPTLDAPWFTSNAIYAHTRDYPLAQPLCLASAMRWLGPRGGRLLFVLLHVLVIALGARALRATDLDARVRCLGVLGLALVPGFVSTGGGAVDSGYAELFVALALVAVAGGTFGRDPLLLASGAAMLPLLKPEGTVYALALVAATGVSGSRTQHASAVLGAALGIALYLPQQAFVNMHGAAPPAWAWMLATAGGAMIALVVKELTLRARPLVLVASGLGAIALVVTLLLALRELLLAQGGTLLGIYLARLESVPGRARELPELLLAYVEHLTLVRTFGFTFILLVALACTPRRVVGPCPSRTLGIFVGIGLVLLLAPFLLSPEEDMSHHLRSSMGRLLLQWTPASWVLAVAWAGQRQPGS